MERVEIHRVQAVFSFGRLGRDVSRLQKDSQLSLPLSVCLCVCQFKHIRVGDIQYCL